MRKKHSYYVYILTNPKKTVLYIGVTNNLARRLVEHYAARGTNQSFAGKYYAYNLVYGEHFKYITRAIAREKEIKKWNRQRKEALIATKNPDWKFYNDFYCGEWPPQKNWGKYMENFINRKKKNTKKKITNTPKIEETVCIYEDDLDTLEAVTTPAKASLAIEEEKSPNNILQTLENTIWQQSILNTRERYLIALSVLTAQGNTEELLNKLKAMPADTFSVEEIDALFLQLSLYTGLPAVKAAKRIVDSVLRNKP